MRARKLETGWRPATPTRTRLDNGELAVIGDRIAMHHSQDPDVHLYYSRVEIEAFFDGVRNGEFDHVLQE